MINKLATVSVTVAALLVTACGESASAPSDQGGVGLAALASKGADVGDVGTLGKAVPEVSCTYFIAYTGSSSTPLADRNASLYVIQVAGTWTGIRFGSVQKVDVRGTNDLNASIGTWQEVPSTTVRNGGYFDVVNEQLLNFPNTTDRADLRATEVTATVVGSRNKILAGPVTCLSSCGPSDEFVSRPSCTAPYIPPG